MELFSEIYNCYYKVVEKILNEALTSPLSKEELSKIINEQAFSESAFYILPKLLSGEWNLIEGQANGFRSKTKGAITPPITTLEKAWIKALLSDKRMKLFLKEENLSFLQQQLQDIEPLFASEDFFYFDSYSDGDDYNSEKYIQNFREVLSAVKKKQTITITFESERSGRISGNYIPIKIEYSSKDDKFRVYVIRIRHGKLITSAIINLSRITQVQPSNDTYKGSLDLEKFNRTMKCKEPVVIEISKERNAVERCMLHFASYEKRTEYDATSDKYICYIYYNKQDETELLIRILSFGPVIKVLGPERFLKQVRDRVRRQFSLLKVDGSF